VLANTSLLRNRFQTATNRKKTRRYLPGLTQRGSGVRVNPSPNRSYLSRLSSPYTNRLNYGAGCWSGSCCCGGGLRAAKNRSKTKSGWTRIFSSLRIEQTVMNDLCYLGPLCCEVCLCAATKETEPCIPSRSCLALSVVGCKIPRKENSPIF